VSRRGWRLVGVALALSSIAIAAPVRSAAAQTTAAAQPVLDLNSASESDLVALKHIGKTKAKKILKGRPWKSKDQLVEKGILTPGEYAEIKERIVARKP
jgi:competence protein ComEA